MEDSSDLYWEICPRSENRFARRATITSRRYQPQGLMSRPAEASGLVGVGDRCQLEFGDGGVVVGIGGVEGESVGDGGGGNERVVGAGGRLSARPAKVGGDPAERPGRGAVEGEGVEVCLCK